MSLRRIFNRKLVAIKCDRFPKEDKDTLFSRVQARELPALEAIVEEMVTPEACLEIYMGTSFSKVPKKRSKARQVIQEDGQSFGHVSAPEPETVTGSPNLDIEIP